MKNMRNPLGWFVGCFDHNKKRTTIIRPSHVVLLFDNAMSAPDEAEKHGSRESNRSEERERLQTSVLRELFPRHIIDAILEDRFQGCNSSLARFHRRCTILFLDVVGFTSMCDKTSAGSVMTFLNTLFMKLDVACTKCKLHKVETAGDCYIVSAGVVDIDEEGYMVIRNGDAKDDETGDGKDEDERDDEVKDVLRIIEFARMAQSTARTIVRPNDGCRCAVRIGIHSGSCTSGIVGTKQPKFALFGDTMNTASRMESTCPVGRVQLSSVTAQLLPEAQRARFERSDSVEIKGKGEMDTFLLPLSPQTSSPFAWECADDPDVDACCMRVSSNLVVLQM